MLVLAVMIAVLAVATLGAVVHERGKREFLRPDGSVKAEGLQGLHTDGRASQAVADSGEVGIGPFIDRAVDQFPNP